MHPIFHPQSVHLSNHFLNQSETIPVGPFVDFVSLNFLTNVVKRTEILDKDRWRDCGCSLSEQTVKVVRARSMSLGCVSIFRICILAYVYYCPLQCRHGCK